jgi:hypothetical protein
MRPYLPPDLCDHPAFIVSSYQWHTWRRTEEEGRLPQWPGLPVRALAAASSSYTAPPLPPQDEDDDDDEDEDEDNEEAKDDVDDFIARLFHDWQEAMAEGRKFDLPPTMTDEEIERPGILVSQVD